METAIRKMGNAQGILITEPIPAQIGLEGRADLQVREGWADEARRLADLWATTHWSGRNARGDEPAFAYRHRRAHDHRLAA